MIFAVQWDRSMLVLHSYFSSGTMEASCARPTYPDIRFGIRIGPVVQDASLLASENVVCNILCEERSDCRFALYAVCTPEPENNRRSAHQYPPTTVHWPKN